VSDDFDGGLLDGPAGVDDLAGRGSGTDEVPDPVRLRPEGPTRRELAERAQRRRAVLVAFVSTVVVFGLLTTLVVSW
jgi:hypothetical protein